MKYKKLSYWLSLYLLIAVIIILGIIILSGYFYVRHLMLEGNRYHLQYEVQKVVDDVENSMVNATRFTCQMSLDYNHDYMQKDPRKYMAMIFDAQPNTYAIAVVPGGIRHKNNRQFNVTLIRSGGRIKPDTGRFSSNNRKVNDWINQMLNKSKPEWSAPFYNPEIGSRTIIYAHPFDYFAGVKLKHATFFCAVALDSHLKNLNRQEMVKPGVVFLLNDKKQIVFSPDSSKTGEDFNSLISYFGDNLYEINKLSDRQSSGFESLNFKNTENNRSTAIYWPVKFANWFIIIIVPENHFISDWKRLTLILIPVIVFIIGVFAAVFIFHSIRLASPISFLADDSRKMVEDEDLYFYDTQTMSKSEMIGQLANKYPLSSIKDIEVLSGNMLKIKDRLAAYRKNMIINNLNKEAIDRDLNLARDIEMGMVPTKFPLVPGRNDFECFGRLIPAEIVGGDLFDIFLLDENQLFFSITDTLGKGIPAAMYSVMTRTFIRSIANPITRLGKVMESLNDALALVRESDMFATVLMGKLDLQTGEFVYCNAGHLHPIIFRNGKQAELLQQSHGIPVGVKRNLQFEETRTFLAPGELMITFTDGVTEQSNEKGEFFGLERLISTIQPMRELSTDEIVNNTLEILDRFRGGTDAHDDLTLIALKFMGK